MPANGRWDLIRRLKVKGENIIRGSLNREFGNKKKVNSEWRKSNSEGHVLCFTLQILLLDRPIVKLFLPFVLLNNKKFNVSRKNTVKVRVKVTLVPSLRLCTGRTAHRGSRGIPLPFHDHGTRSG